MFASKISQVPKPAAQDAGSRWMAVARVMFCLAVCLLIGAIAPTAVASPGNDSTPPQRLYARQANGIWISDDAGTSWTQAGALPSRPLSLAVAQGTQGQVFVGTESLGLYRSNDGGASWQPVESAALGLAQGAPVAVTALAIDPEDEQIVYAATNVWLGTNTAHLAPLGVAVSVDGGRHWLQLSRARLGDTPLQRLEPVPGRPLSVVTVRSTGSHTVSLALSPELLRLLQDADPAIRACAARAIGLIGDATALAGPRPAHAVWALGKTLAPALPSSASTGVSIEPERLPVNPAPIFAPFASPVAPALLVALPAASVDVPANYWTLAALLALALLVVVAGVLIWKGPRPTSKLGHT